VYVLATQYPLTINFSVAVGGSQAAPSSLTIENPYTLTKGNVSVARFTVLVISDDNSAKAVVEVFGATGVNITRLANVGQSSSFFLPAGSYRVTATQGLNSLSAMATLTNGSDNTVKLDLSTFQRLEVALTLTAVVGVVSILLYWAVGSWNLKPRLTRFPHD
jgi:hypothetical protein